VTIRLHIERLILDGLPVSPREHAGLLELIRADLALHLTRLDPFSVQTAHHRSLQVREEAPVSLHPSAHPLGARIATTTFQALTPQEEHR
jgi:hypothetical protein